VLQRDSGAEFSGQFLPLLPSGCRFGFVLTGGLQDHPCHSLNLSTQLPDLTIAFNDLSVENAGEYLLPPRHMVAMCTTVL
jgi:hypothetical protein